MTTEKTGTIETTVHCKKGAFPACKMVEYLATDPKFIAVILTVGRSQVTYYLRGEEECLAFKESVEEACGNLQTRLYLKSLKEGEGENEES